MTKSRYLTIAAVAMTLVMALTIGDGIGEVHPLVPGTSSLRMPAVLLFTAGIGAGVALVWSFAQWIQLLIAEGSPLKVVERTLIPASVIAAIYFGGAAAYASAIPPLRIAIVLMLVTAALLCGHRLLAALERGEAIGIESHWGGLGGGSGGWRLAPATTMVFLTLTFTSAAIIVALVEPSQPQKLTPSPSTTPTPRPTPPASIPPPTATPANGIGAGSNATVPAGNAAGPAS